MYNQDKDEIPFDADNKRKLIIGVVCSALIALIAVVGIISHYQSVPAPTQTTSR